MATKTRLVNFELSENDVISEDEDRTQFDNLCDLTLACASDMNTALAELGLWKDEALNHTLPANMMLRLLVLFGRMHRSVVDVQMPVVELVRLVRLYSQPWQRKSTALSRLHEDYDQNKRQLDLALRRISMSGTDMERFRTERLFMNWERLFSKLLTFRKHSRRWKFLVDSFHELMREGKPLPVVSDSDDDSDDEPPEKKLPEKVTSKKNGKAMHRMQRKPTDAVAGLMKEQERLQGQVAQMQTRIDDLLTLKPTRGQFVQTEPMQGFVKPPMPFKSDLNELFADSAVQSPVNDHCIALRPKQISGFGSFIPQDMACVVDVHAPGSNLPKDRTASTVQAQRIRARDCITIDQMLAVHGVGEADEMRISLVSGIGGQVMAYGTAPASAFLETVNGSKKEWLTDNVSRTSILDSTVSVKLRATKEYLAFRNESRAASAGSNSSYDESPYIIAEFGAAVVLPEDLEDAAAAPSAVPESYIDSLPATPAQNGRRRNRLRQALEESKAPEESETNNVAANIFQTLDVSEEELTQATFTMQEMMELAMLHAKQLQMLQQQHDEDVRALQELATQRPAAVSRAMQTDHIDLEPKTKIVKETIVERVEVPVRVEVPYEVRVEVPVEVRVEVPVIVKEPAQIIYIKDNDATPVQLTMNRPVRVYRQLPDSFMERLMLFTEQSLKRRAELIERIQGEQRIKIEQQHESRFILADPNKPRRPDEDVCLPALFMPSPGVVYSPRAAQYWHPAGSKDPRFSQPPTVISMPEIKLPPIAASKPVNLYEMSKSMDATVRGTPFGDPSEADDESVLASPSRVQFAQPMATTERTRPGSADANALMIKSVRPSTRSGLVIARVTQAASKQEPSEPTAVESASVDVRPPSAHSEPEA